MKKIFFVAVTLTSAIQMKAQQEPQYAHFIFNTPVFNPASTGSDLSLCATAIFRTQWTGITGNPVTENILIHSPVHQAHGGLGVILTNDNAGAARNTKVHLAYSFILPVSNANLSFGISGGLIQAGLNGEILRAPDGNYFNTINHNDPRLPVSQLNTISPDMNAGIFFWNKNLRMGISSTQIIPGELHWTYSDSSTSFKLQRNEIFSGSCRFRISDRTQITPSMLLKSDEKHIQAELNILASFSKIWGGIGYRGYSSSSSDAAIGFVGYQIYSSLMAGYAFEYPVTSLARASNGTHEIFINYKLNLFATMSPGKIIFTPRF